MSQISIIGMACRYAEARSPRQLWENVLAQRRSFRRIPSLRLSLDDYSRQGEIEDQIYLTTAAVLEDYDFDRVRFQVSKETFASTDLAHWLALDVARQALEDAKLLDSSDRQRERVGVYIGNSLTGEFSRASLLRLRWPYVRRVLAAALQKNGVYQNGDLHKLIAEIEALYKAPFPATTEESLAGGLSNTIAGRICNYFNLKGGGYTVDGACASSLLAVTTACAALESGDVDVAIAGGVDLSLDPFELAGFSKLGALARDSMRVFDARSSGFWPGEGCGMVVLMRHEEAAANHHASYAVLRGWGISSDGSGGITRPEVSGQLLALRRAYHRAGYGMDSVNYFEGHGTGTSVGDAAELQALSLARREARSDAAPAALGSVKANIGHTKAAAGVAGLIKATMAVQAGILPPTTGCDTPHPELMAERPALRVLKEGELWPEAEPVRAGVSAMGFGGINTHLTLEAADSVRRRNFTGFERQQLSSVQDCELFLFQADDAEALAQHLEEVAAIAGEISFAEMADLAAALAAELAKRSADDRGMRAACVASSPEELERQIRKLQEWLAAGTHNCIDSSQGIFLGSNEQAPGIGFLFTGQGAPVYTHGGRWARRFPAIRDLYAQAHLPTISSVATEVAQPCVVTASLAGLHALELCGIEACVALGHSLGEITALCWAGACGKEDLLRLARERGRIMAEMGAPSGSMASVRAGWEEVKRRINGDGLSIAAYNSRTQTVVSGDAAAVRQFAARLSADGVSATVLPVSHAFHSPLVAGVAESFRDYLSGERFGGLRRRLVSTVTASVLEEDINLQELLTRQITFPVRFAEALAVAANEVDLFIEVGPGAVLSGIAAECADVPVIALNAGGESLRGLLLAAGAAFSLGAKVRVAALFEDRFVRPLDLKRRHTFLQNPCETILDSLPARPALAVVAASASPAIAGIADAGDAMDVLRTLIAQRTELPLATIKPESRFLDDLHLNSITVSQVILQAAAQLNLPVPVAPTEYANVTIAEAAKALDAARQGPVPATEKIPRGVDSWIRMLGIEWVERKPRSGPRPGSGSWQVLEMRESSLQASLHQEFEKVPGKGMVCISPAVRDEAAAVFLLESAQMALRQKLEQMVFVGRGAAALARSLHLEHPRLKVTVVDVPLEHPEAAEWIAQEARCASGFTEARYGPDEIRREPRLQLLWPEESKPGIGLGKEDVLLVTGGGKGIAAECALVLARESRCSLALMGRSDPASDQQLQENLLRFRQSGISFRYVAADVGDPRQISQAVQQVEAELGGITAILHGTGSNSPKRLEEIIAADVHGTLSPKINGLRNVLNSVHPEKLRLLITFGSIIGRTGLHGESHYGLANDWMAEMVQRWQSDHPECRCLNLDWSVWAGAGMGQRLGVLDSLARQGITPLPLEDAISALKTMLAWNEAPVSSIVTGRFGNLPTLRFPESELPLRRFLEHTQLHYPGVELIADAELSADTDPYLAEHVFQGEQLLPAVCGMEAMAQVAAVLEGREPGELPEFHHLRFEHPIVVPPRKSVRIRIAALRRQPGRVSVAVRCSSTGFQVDHFSGECVFGSKEKSLSTAELGLGFQQQAQNSSYRVHNGLALDPERDLYGRILFHHGRFRRVEKYRRLQASQSVADLSAPKSSPWYARHLPPEFIAGDPSSRDSALHSIQACIPHKTILPVGIERVIPTSSWTLGRATVQAVERVRDGDNFLYDVAIQNEAGETCEVWEGLHLRAVASIEPEQPWPALLLAPYLERKLVEALPGAGLQVTLGCDCETEIESAICRMFGADTKLAHRPDGKPEILGRSEAHVSLSHAGRIALIVSGKEPVGCDVEPIVSRDKATWEQLLGPEGSTLAKVVAEKSNLSLDTAATQVWTLKESLRKAGASFVHPLQFERATQDNWMVFSGGEFLAASFHARLQEPQAEFAFAFVVRRPITKLEPLCGRLSPPAKS